MGQAWAPLPVPARGRHSVLRNVPARLPLESKKGIDMELDKALELAVILGWEDMSQVATPPWCESLVGLC